MEISKLNSGQGNVEVEGVITEIGETRTFAKYGKNLTVANAILSDDSGSIKLSLWNDDVKRFKEGDKIKIINGYCSEFQGEKQLTSGKFGRMEKTGEGEVVKGDKPDKKDIPPGKETGNDELVEDIEEGLGEDYGEELF